MIIIILFHRYYVPGSMVLHFEHFMRFAALFYGVNLHFSHPLDTIISLARVV